MPPESSSPSDPPEPSSNRSRRSGGSSSSHRHKRHRSKSRRSLLAAPAKERLKICRFCGNRSTKGGSRCPQCGHSYKVRMSVIPIIFIGLFLALLIALFVVK